MLPAQLTRLRSQINILTTKFSESKEFELSILSFLKLYALEKRNEKFWVPEETTLPHMHVPDSVMLELIMQIGIVAKIKPKAALRNADLLWASEFYEMKYIAISMLANLAETHPHQVIERIHHWIQSGVDNQLMSDIMKEFEHKPHILLNREWIGLLASWLDSGDEELVRLGLRAMRHTIEMGYDNLPYIFSILSSIIRQPNFSIQKYLIELIKALINKSEAETASFLIATGKLNPEIDVNVFIRKCLPLFDPFFQGEILAGLQ